MSLFTWIRLAMMCSNSSIHFTIMASAPDTKEESEKVRLEADEGCQDEGQAGPDPSQAGLDPGDAGAKVQSIPSPVVHAGSDREHMDLDVADVSPQPFTEQLDEGFTATAYPKVQENLKLAIEEHVLLEDPASSSGTLSSLQHLSKDISFGDLFFSDRPSNADKNAETEVESMVHQQFKATTTDITTTTTTTTLPPQAQQQSTAEAMMSDTKEESEKVGLEADEGGQDEGQAGPDPSQAGLDPGDAGAKVQSIPSPVVHAGSDREHMDLDVADVSPQPFTEQLDEGFTAMAYPKVQENLKLAIEEHVLLEDPASSSGTLSSLQHLSKDISFG
nr:hypothetical protein [Tanacetum cinerariifolium]